MIYGIDYDDKDTYYNDGFVSGQQSRQEEVDKLQSQIDSLELKLKSKDHSAREVINAMSMSCGEYLKEIDDLQKRIDSLVPLLENCGYLGWVNILKGNKDEN